MDIENTDTTTARVLESTAIFDKVSLLLRQKNTPYISLYRRQRGSTPRRLVKTSYAILRLLFSKHTPASLFFLSHLSHASLPPQTGTLIYSLRRGSSLLRQFWQVTDSMSKCSPKVIQKFVCRGGRAKKYFVYFKTDNKDKRIFCLLLVHLLVLLVACGATRPLTSWLRTRSWGGAATFDKVSLLLEQKNNTVHICTVYFFTPATPYFPRQLPAKYHRHHGA